MKAARPFFVYTVLLFIVGGWWWAAFFFSPSFSRTSSKDGDSQKTVNSSFAIPRDRLIKALLGDIEEMKSLILSWDLAAHDMEIRGLEPQRLSPDEFREFILLTFDSHRMLDPKVVVDDWGHAFRVDHLKTRLLPQTEVAATLLLAMVPTSSLLAIPQGMKESPFFSLDPTLPSTKSLSAEELYVLKPEMAFVASYSNPVTVEAWKRLQIPCFGLDQIGSLQDVLSACIKVGEAIGSPERGKILKLFIQASFYAVDNLMLDSGFDKENASAVLLYQHLTWSVPSQTCALRDITSRLKINQDFKDEVLSKEELLRLNPDILMIVQDPDPYQEVLFSTPPLSSLKAVQDRRLYFLDRVMMDSPTQLLALAYRDLAYCLLETPIAYKN